MAFVGLRHPVWAPIESETDGTEPVYGKGVVVGRAMQADVSFKRSDTPLYADDVAAESDNSITGGSVTLGVDDLSDEAAEAMLGDVAGKDGEIAERCEGAPYGGFGYMRVRRLRGVTSYIGYWLYKTQFGRGDENAKTRGETLEWQTPTVSGSVLPVYADESGAAVCRIRRSFKTAAEAEAWLDARANIEKAVQAAAQADAQTGA